MNQFRNGTFQALTAAHGLPSNLARINTIEPDGTVWIGTASGLSRIRGKEIRTVTVREGLYDNLAYRLLDDGLGNYWSYGNRGIWRVCKADLHAVADGRLARLECVSFGEADGMASAEGNGEQQPNAARAHDGRLWFPTTRGVVVVDPKRLDQNEVPPPVVIEQVKVGDEVVFGDGAGIPAESLSALSGQPHDRQGSAALSRTLLRLAPGRARVLQIRYTANGFVAPERVRFKYRLKGHDKDWRDADSDERVVYYTSLSPGDYTFHVKACNNHGYWNETGDQFAFSLAPKFTQTAWFPVSLVLGGIGLSLALFTWRLRWQRRVLRLEQQQAPANERTRIARDLHDDLGTALTGLALELDVTRRAAPSATELPQRLAESARHTRDLAERMREVVWAVNPKCDNVPSLANFLEQQAAQFLRAAGLQVRIDFPEDIPAKAVNSDTRHQLALAVREALTNIVRHASANKVTVSLAIEDDSLVLRLADDGCGFCVANVRNGGHGLANLRARLERVGGHFECVSSPGAGTTVTFVVPLGTDALGE